MSDKKKHKIVIECNSEAKDSLLPILDTLRYLGSAGSSRSVEVEDHGSYFFDGDGPDRIHSIEVDGDEVKSGDFTKVSRSLWKDVVKIAYKKPELRGYLLPLLTL